MAGIKLKSSIWEEEAIGDVSTDARLTFVGVLTVADGRGIYRGTLDTFKGRIFPSDNLDDAQVLAWLTELHMADLLVVYWSPWNGGPDDVTIEVCEWRRFTGSPSRPPIPAGIRQAVIDRDGRTCGICSGRVSEDEQIHIDHVFPWSLGGSDELDNLQVSHADCNMRKGARV